MSLELIPAVAVTAANLTSNVVESPPAAWAGGTTYALGDEASVFTGTKADVYESLVAGNIGNAPAGSPVQWRYKGIAYKDWNGVDTFVADDIVNRGNKLWKASPGGTNNDPLTTAGAASWTDQGASNRHAMFDARSGTPTVWRGSIDAEIDVADLANRLCLLRINASALNVTVLDGLSEVSNVDYSLVSDDGILDYWDWCFGPIIRKTNFVADLPNVYNPTVRVALSAGDDEDVSVGNAIVGLARDLGDTQFGIGSGFIDLSKKIEDGFGGWYIAPRDYSLENSFKAWVPSARVDYVMDLLKSFRATPVVLIGSRTYGCTFGFGLVSGRVSIDYAEDSVLSIEFKGL